MLAHAALEWASLGENLHPILGPPQLPVTSFGRRLIATASRPSWIPMAQRVRQIVRLALLGAQSSPFQASSQPQGRSELRGLYRPGETMPVFSLH